MARVLPDGRLPFYLGGGEVHGESPEVRARREAREALARAAALGRVTPLPEDVATQEPVPTGLDVEAPPPAAPAPVSDAERVLVRAKTASKGGVAPAPRLPPVKARLLNVVAAESPRVAEYMRQSLGLEEPQQEAARRSLAVNLGRAGAMVNEALTGAKYDREAYQGLEEEAQRPVTDVLAREALSRQEWQDYGGERERVARLQDAEDERAGRSTQQALALAQDTRSQEQRVEDATRADTKWQVEQGADAAARSQQQAQFNARMAEERRQAAEKAAAGGGRGLGAAGLPPEERLAKATVAARVSPIVASLQRIEQVLPGSTTGGASAGGADAWSRALANAPGGFGSWLTTDKGLALTREVQNLRDVVKRARSGAAISAAEEADYLRLIDDAALSDPRALAVGLDIVRREVGQKLADINAGYDPAVVQRYQERGGTTAQSPIVAGMPSAPTRGPVRMRAPDGVEYEVDASEAPEAERNGWRRL